VLDFQRSFSSVPKRLRSKKSIQLGELLERGEDPKYEAECPDFGVLHSSRETYAPRDSLFALSANGLKASGSGKVLGASVASP